jgi:hypothetical protein
MIAESPSIQYSRERIRTECMLVYLKNMRLWFTTLAISVCTLFGQESPEMVRAQEQIAKLRDLVAVGAVAPLRLQEAEQKLADAKDDQILHRTLYGKLTVQDLTEEQSREMLQAAQRRFDRQAALIEQSQKLVDAGVIARGDLGPLELELESRRLTIALATSRAKLLDELTEMARREQAMETADDSAPRQGLSIMEHFEGDGRFSTSALKAVTLAFEKKFKRPFPISANGETSMHRSLGFDHRGRVDVAITPDQREGVWLRSYLEANEIPYYAFRSAVAGKATGAHIHIGPGSTRLRAAD